MRRSIMASVVAMCILGMAASAGAQQRIGWLENLSQAQDLARRQHRLVLLHFWSPSCAPCLKMERQVFNQPEVIRAVMGNYVPVKIDATADPQQAAQFGVSRWPMDVITTADGEEVYRGVCNQDSNQYIAVLNQIAAHTRIGMPVEGSAYTAASPGPGRSLDDGQAGRDSSFPLPSHTGMAGAPQHLTATHSAAAPPAGPPTMVTNQYADPMAQALPANRSAIAPPYGGQFTPPPASQPNVPAGFMQPAASPPPPGSVGMVPQQAWQAPAAGGSSTITQRDPNADRPGAVAPPPGQGSANVVGSAPGGSSTSSQLSEPAGEPDTPPLGLEGYCPVTLVEQQKWVKGDPKWGAIHEGRLYLFVGPEPQQRFLAAFQKYAPMLAGNDPVKYVDEGVLVEGRRAHGVFYRDQIYLFADEASLQTFWTQPERYVLGVLAARRQQVETGMRR